MICNSDDDDGRVAKTDATICSCGLVLFSVAGEGGTREWGMEMQPYLLALLQSSFGP